MGKAKGPRLAKSLSLKKLIDDFLAAETVVTVNNEKQRLTNYKAILSQLWSKAVSERNQRARKVFLKFVEDGACRGGREFEVRFAPKPKKPRND